MTLKCITTTSLLVFFPMISLKINNDQMIKAIGVSREKDIHTMLIIASFVSNFRFRTIEKTQYTSYETLASHN